MARTNMIGVRVTAEERAVFDGQARAAGKSTSEWLRHLGHKESWQRGVEALQASAEKFIPQETIVVQPGPPGDVEW